MKKMLLFIYAFTLSHAFVKAATVDTVVIRSHAMQKDIKCVVVKPDSYTDDGNKPYPVVYMLHGYSGNFSNWISRAPLLKDYSDKYETIIVCPDGGFSSWYFDSPVDSTMRYETYVSKEVPEFIDAHYKTIPKKNGRAITGLSMGGHGGLFLGFRHPDVFGACGSMSGGVDLFATHERFDINKRFASGIWSTDKWKPYSVMYVIENYPTDSIAVIFDCGTEDFFYKDNHALHEKMVQLKIPHDYIERPGQHNWDYWRNAVQYQLLFFSNYFNSSKK